MAPEEIILADGHVHIHDCFDLNVLLKAAYANFKKYAHFFNAEAYEGVLCLTEISKVNRFNELKGKAERRERSGDLTFCLTGEENSIKVSRNNEAIYIIAGKQIVAKENLEILGLGLKADIEDGKPVREILKYIIDAEAVPVIPWGAGKWIGKRNKVINEIINQNEDLLFLGDNGNRPYFWSKPGVFSRAEEKNIFNLQGSDPLPFKYEETKAGKFGFILHGKLNSLNPFKDFREKIIKLEKPFKTYGDLEGPSGFFRNQLMMQLEKRKRKSMKE